MVWRRDDPAGDESGKIRWSLVPYTRGRGLDLGCGPSKAFPHFIGVDNYTDTQLFGIQMKPDVVADVTKLDLFGSASMDFVFSSHVLEHIAPEKVTATLKEWWRVIQQGGYLILYLPDEDEYPKVGEDGANPDHKWNVNYERLVSYMSELGSWDLVRYEKRNQDREYSLFFVFRKLSNGGQRFSFKDKTKPAKSCAVVRYGAFGDMIQLSSVLPGLKEQGFHVTVYTTPRGKEVLEHDPHVDEFVIQDTDQVPNHALGDYWDHEKKKFDRWVQFSESIEGQLLALPGRPNHSWSKEMRDKYLDVNYFEFMHDLAGVPLPPKPKFYATDEEKAWAKKERRALGGDRLVMYSLAGSSVHKVWPHMDSLFARILLDDKGTHIVTVGDEMSQMLEMGWEKEPRVKLRSGKYTIRQSMALLAECDMVIGPETGMLNAAGHMTVPKIVFLSHSSANNLTAHWINTAALEPEQTRCFPCHQMHYGFEFCHKSPETGVSLCASNISVDQAWDAYKVFTLKKAA